MYVVSYPRPTEKQPREVSVISLKQVYFVYISNSIVYLVYKKCLRHNHVFNLC